jgi:hypothetical protein
MKRILLPIAAALLILLLGSPATGAETFIVTCHVCDKVDVGGKGLKANATYTVLVRDVRTGQRVIPNPTTVTTDASGAFSYSYPLDLAAHPSLQGSLYNITGTETLLAAHSRFTAPLKCGRTVPLPYTGSPSRLPLLSAFSALLIGIGGALVFATRARVHVRR